MPMTMESVQQIAAKYGIELSDIRFVIDKGRSGIHGVTRADQSVMLCRNAFHSEEDLARTLAHERFHVEELRAGRPYPRNRDEAIAFEDRAYAHEDQWWGNHPVRPED